MPRQLARLFVGYHSYVIAVLVTDIFGWDVVRRKLAREDRLEFVSDIALDLDNQLIVLEILTVNDCGATGQLARQNLGAVSQIAPVGF